MKLGFTGTHFGMSSNQMNIFFNLLKSSIFTEITEFHHGCCIGADKEAHSIIFNHHFTHKTQIIIHPPIKQFRMFQVKADKRITLLPAKEFIIRDHDIVNCSDILIAAPAQDTEIVRSGTWATIRYAKKVGKEIVYLKR